MRISVANRARPIQPLPCQTIPPAFVSFFFFNRPCELAPHASQCRVNALGQTTGKFHVDWMGLAISGPSLPHYRYNFQPLKIEIARASEISKHQKCWIYTWCPMSIWHNLARCIEDCRDLARSLVSYSVALINFHGCVRCERWDV